MIWTDDSRIGLEASEELNQCGKDFNLGGSLPLLKLWDLTLGCWWVFHTPLRVEVIETIVPHLWFPTCSDVLRCSELASTTMFPLRWSSLPLHPFYFYTSYQVRIHLGLDYWQFLSLISTFQCPLWSLHECFILILSYHKKGCNSVPSSLEGLPCTLHFSSPNSKPSSLERLVISPLKSPTPVMQLPAVSCQNWHC